MLRFVCSMVAASILVGCAGTVPHARGEPSPPFVDHHQHLMSPAGAQLVNSALGLHEKAVTGADMIKLLDEAGMKRAVILSDAYFFDSPPAQTLPNYPELVRRENDWTASEAERHPGRLIAFCSFNPLLKTGLSELDRCAASKRFRGVKLHFDVSGVDLRKPDHVAMVRAAFASANRHRLPIVIHAAVGPPRSYGAAEARVMIDRLLPAAPDVPVVICHLWGGGNFAGEVLAAYVEAIQARLPQTRRLYFDVAQAQMTTRNDPGARRLIAAGIRQIGVERVFYGSDGPEFGGETPAVAWREFRQLIPLTPAEHDRIARNVAPFAK